MTLIEAIKKNDTTEFFRLLKLPLTSSERSVIDEIDSENGGNALHVAAAFNRIDFVVPLVEAGIDLNRSDNDGWTPVYIAASEGYGDVITALKASGADVDRQNDDGVTPIYVATENGHVAAIRALGVAGANLNAPNSDGSLPIVMVVQSEDVATMAALLEAGANANLKISQGTLLEQAKKQVDKRKTKESQEIVRLLEAHLKHYPSDIKTTVDRNTEAALSDKSKLQTAQNNLSANNTQHPLAYSDLNPPCSDLSVALQSFKQRRFLQIQGALNNRITHMLHKVQQKIIVLEKTLQEMPDYWELQKTVFCKALFDLQFSVIGACLSISIDWDTVNQNYQEQLNKAYEETLEFLCLNWLSSRKTYLSDSVLESEARRFKNMITERMQSQMQNFQSLKLAFTEIKRIEGQLIQQKNKLEPLLQQLQKKLASMETELANLVNQFNTLKTLRTQLQTPEITDWHSPLQMLSDIAKQSFQETPNTADADGLTLVHYACWSGHLPLVKKLIEQGHRILMESQEGYSALHFAVENTTANSISLLELLFKTAQQPIDSFLSLKTKRGKISLHIAASYGNLAAVTWLLQKLPHTINMTDKQGLTPLHEAARHGHADTVQHLLSLGANGRALDGQQDTPIVLAVLEGHFKTAQVFFDNGFWLNKAESLRCLKTIEKHPNPQAVVDSIAIVLNDITQLLSQLNLRAAQNQREVSVEQTSSPGYFPLYQLSVASPVNVHLLPETVSEHKQPFLETGSI